MDVYTAFLNADIDEDIWVKIPEGTKLAANDDEIYKLRKSLYGIKQASRNWNNDINQYLLDNGFTRLEINKLQLYRLQERMYHLSMRTFGCQSSIRLAPKNKMPVLSPRTTTLLFMKIFNLQYTLDV